MHMIEAHERAQEEFQRLKVESDAAKDALAEAATLRHKIELLEMKIEAQVEIIAAYRDSLECFQNEKRVASQLHRSDLSELTKPKSA